jgi:site-specific recombinase XerC
MATSNVQYLVAALARNGGVAKHLTPHGLRHSAIPVGLDVASPCVTCRTLPGTSIPTTIRR